MKLDDILLTMEAAAQKAEIAALKTALEKLQQELADLKKPKPEKK